MRLRRKQLVLDVAALKFARTGYARTTLRDISQAAGQPLTTLHTDFGSKQEILRLILDEAFTDARAAITSAAAAAQVCRRGGSEIDCEVDAIVDWTLANPIWTCVLTEAWDHWVANPDTEEANQDTFAPVGFDRLATGGWGRGLLMVAGARAAWARTGWVRETLGQQERPAVVRGLLVAVGDQVKRNWRGDDDRSKISL
jgi:AcrR family transcriptional regulator